MVVLDLASGVVEGHTHLITLRPSVSAGLTPFGAASECPR